MAAERRRIGVRLPDEIHDRLAAAAAADHRSINAYLTVLLDRVLPAAEEQTELDLAG